MCNIQLHTLLRRRIVGYTELLVQIGRHLRYTYLEVSEGISVGDGSVQGRHRVEGKWKALESDAFPRIYDARLITRARVLDAFTSIK